MHKFWNWVKNQENNGRTLYFDGVISENTWYEDEITPEEFRKELFSGNGEVIIWLNSPGGDCIAASRIYSMLIEYQEREKSDIIIKIDGLAASAASVIAMAGTKILMFPTAMMMIHNPLTFAVGDAGEMKKAAEVLDEFKESIINAYEKKTGKERAFISELMDAETWMSANKAVELGFADGLTGYCRNELCSSVKPIQYLGKIN